MNKKDILLSAIVSIVIVIIIFIPPVISDLQNIRLEGVVKVEAMSSLNIDEAQEMSHIDKIELIASFGVEGESVIMTAQDNAENTSLSLDQVKDVCANELIKLQNIGLVPDADFTSEPQYIRYSIETYVDAKQPSKYVIVWKINLIYSDLLLDLMIDDQTHAIYKLYYYDYNMKIKLTPNQIGKAWGEYLGMEMELLNDYKEVFNIMYKSPEDYEARIMYYFDVYDTNKNISFLGMKNTYTTAATIIDYR